MNGKGLVLLPLRNPFGLPLWVNIRILWVTKAVPVTSRSAQVRVGPVPPFLFDVCVLSHSGV